MKMLRLGSPRAAVLAALAALILAACGSSSGSPAGAITPSASSSGAITPSGALSSATAGNASGATAATSAGAGTTPGDASPGNLAEFKADIVNAQQSGKAIGSQLTSTLERAGKMTDAQIVEQFTALSKKVDAYANSVSHFPATPKFRAAYQLIVQGFHAVASDLADIAKLAYENAGTSPGKTAIEKLYNDMQGLAGAETTLDKAVGLSS